MRRRKLGRKSAFALAVPSKFIATRLYAHFWHLGGLKTRKY